MEWNASKKKQRNVNILRIKHKEKNPIFNGIR